MSSNATAQSTVGQMLTNGGSLEDCYTNVYVLGELTKLRWRRYQHVQQSNQSLNDDLILQAYVRCSRAGLLTAWRRTPPNLCTTTSVNNPLNMQANKLDPLRLDVLKELIVFWYGPALPEQLDAATAVLGAPSVDCALGWKDIDYDTRCMLFHAWHNMLQRYFEIDGYVRMGRWFVRPLDAQLATSEHGAPQHLTAFRLSFMLQEVHICVSATMQRQAVLHQLGERHVKHAVACAHDASQRRQSVVLAPWSVTATLIGASRDRGGMRGGPWSSERPSSNAMRKMWTSFHPSLLTRANSADMNADESDEDTPSFDAPWTEGDDVMAASPSKKAKRSNKPTTLMGRMVEVEVCGVRMHYPSAFVCVQRADDQTLECNTMPKHKQPSSAVDDMTRKHAERPVSGLLLLQRSLEANITIAAPPPPTTRTVIGMNTGRPTWHLSDGVDRVECCCASTSFAQRPTLRRRPSKAAPTTMHTTEKLQPPTAAVKHDKILVDTNNPSAPHTNQSGHQMISPALTDVKPEMSAPNSTQPPSVSQPAIGKRRADVSPAKSTEDARHAQCMSAQRRRMAAFVAADRKPTDVKPSINGNRPRLYRVDARVYGQSPFGASLFVNRSTSGVHGDYDQPTWADCLPSRTHDVLPVDTIVDQPVVERRAPQLNEELTTLPENILEEEGAHNFMSPPASNEAAISNEQRQLVNQSRAHAGIAPEVDYIYPTPPSVQDFHMSPDNLPIKIVHNQSESKHSTTLCHASTSATPAKLERIDEEVDVKCDPYGVFARRANDAIARLLLDDHAAVYDAQLMRSTELKRRRGAVIMARMTYTPTLAARTPPRRPTTLVPTAQRPTQYRPPMPPQYNPQTPNNIPSVPSSQPTPLQHQLQQPLQPPPPAFTAGIPFAAIQHASSMLTGGPRMPPTPLQRQPSSVGPSTSSYNHPMSPYTAATTVYSPYHGGMTPSQRQAHDAIQSPHSMTNRLHGQPSSVEGGWHHQHSVGSSMMPSVLPPNVTQHMEANSLLFSILLCDTPLDLFHDVNFDMCSVCVCNSGSIRGNEAGHYVPYTSAMIAQVEQQHAHTSSVAMLSPTAGNVKCTCAFSAVRHRAVSQQSGAFIEDEIEATGDSMLWDPVKKHALPADKRLVELVREQSVHRDMPSQLLAVSCLERQCTETLIQRSQQILKGHATADYKMSRGDMLDIKQLMWLALETAVKAADSTLPTNKTALPFSLWAYYKATKEMHEPDELDTMYTLTCIRDTLTTHLPTTASLKAIYAGDAAVDHGPLTWRQFEMKITMANKKEVQLCRPEPVPAIVLQTVDNEYISMSPHGLRLWDRLMLQPYSTPKDILYLAIVPDATAILRRARVFFDDMCKTYEQHRFGRHLPLCTDKSLEARLPVAVGLTKVDMCHLDTGADNWPADGGYAQRRDVADKDAWFDDDDHPNGLVAELAKLKHISKEQRDEFTAQIRAYARVCRSVVPTILATNAAFERCTFNQSADAWHKLQEDNGVVNDMPPPPVGADTPNAVSLDEIDGLQADQPTPLPHCVQIYMVDPFNCGPLNRHVRVSRLITQALNRCYLGIIRGLLPQHAVQVQLEIVSLQTLLDTTGVMVDYAKDVKDTAIGLPSDPGRTVALRSSLPRQSSAECMRQMCMNVYCETRALTAEHIIRAGPGGKSLTGMGPIADRVVYLRDHHFNVEQHKQRYYRYACIPYALAPATVPAPLVINVPPNSKVSASEMLAAQPLVTPNDGGDADHVLMVSYCLSDSQRWLLATATNARGTIMETCMINVDEFVMKESEGGERIDPKTLPAGFNERLFSRRTNVIRESLNQLWAFIMSVMSTGCHPWRLVIGRVGRIGHGELKVWSQLLRAPAKFGMVLKDKCAQCAGMPHGKRNHTPADQPCILSACIVAIEPEPNLRVLPSEFAKPDAPSSSSVRTPADVSTTHIVVVRMSACVNDPTEVAGDDIGDDLDFDFGDLGDFLSGGDAGVDTGLLDMLTADMPGGSKAKETDVGLESQPLAVGYYISTAPAAGMPNTWWSQCDAARRQSPVHLRASLHVRVNAADMNDDQLTSGASSSAPKHVLDTSMPADVLRWVLETYNALSWLNVDLMTGERRSCMPIHVQTLMNMNRSVMVLIPDRNTE